MKELKFRAWDTKYNVLLCDGFNVIGEVTLFNGVEITLGEQSKLHNDTTPLLERLLNDVIIEQFTGLKDRNGVEIFEGDIVNIYNWGYKNNGLLGTSEIEFDLDNGCWQTKQTIVEDQYDFYRKAIFEVIGNIHQTPDLL